jgi:60 kDa SS-A/Ro ribonucleoprotein
VRCIDVAALFTVAMLRRNPEAEVLPFEQDVVDLDLDPTESVMENAARLAAVGGGGTNCSAPLALLNRESARGDLVVIVSDDQSWVDARSGRGTELMIQWEIFRARNPRARLVCIDVQPYGTTQASEREDILNVGGFSDRVFEVVGRFADGTLAGDHWAGVIEEVEL